VVPVNDTEVTVIDIGYLAPRPVRPDEVPELRTIFWRQVRLAFWTFVGWRDWQPAGENFR